MRSPAEMIDADAFNAFEAAGWEQKAASYDKFVGQITSRVIGPLLDAVQVRRGNRLLDLATGPGYAASRAAERGAQVVGIDRSAAMVALARECHPGLDFRQADAEALPFPDSSFDAGVGNFLILHLGRPEQAAAEFVRVLAPGGRLALTAWDVPGKARFLGVFLDAVAAAGATVPEEVPKGPEFFRFSRDEEFSALLRGAGLENVKIETIAFTIGASSADQLWEGILGGAVRTSALILRQTHDSQRRIRVAFDEVVSEYQTGDGSIELPVSVKLASGSKAL